MKRFLSIFALSIAILQMETLADNGHGGHHNHHTNFKESVGVKEFNKEILIPPMLEGTVKDGVREFELNVTKGEWEFLDGKIAKTYGYNGPILGPVLKMNKGEKTRVKIKNNLDDVTTVHWHGGILSEDVDGVHNADILPGDVREVEYTLNQPAATLWFHPHPMHKTASQVYKGLAGLLYLEDENSKELDIPKTYGKDDFPIVIQDKKIYEDGSLEYKTTKMEKIHGKSGGYLMINGIISPYVNVVDGFVRLRVVNGSNATNYNVDFNGEEFYQIASDGGFLNNPVKMDTIELAPGERAELLVNTKNLDKKSYLMVNGKKAIELRKTSEKGLERLPKKLEDIPEITQNLENLTVRKFALKTTSKGNTINDTPYNMDKMNFDVKKGTQEVWEIKNGSKMMDMPHPFHVHGAQFRIIERNGEKPVLNERGWKDTVNLDAGDTVKILITYTTDGVTVYHCHILEHEEDGMMGQFEIVG